MATGTYRMPLVQLPKPADRYDTTNESQFRHLLEQSFASMSAYISGLLSDPVSVTKHASTHAAAGSDPVSLAWSQITSGVPAFLTKTVADGYYDAIGAAAAITLAGLGGVPTTRQVAGHALSGDVTLTAADIAAGNFPAGNYVFPATVTVVSLSTVSGDLLLATTPAVGTRYARLEQFGTATIGNSVGLSAQMLSGSGAAYYGNFSFVATGISGGAHSGKVVFQLAKAGTLVNVLTLDQDSTATFVAQLRAPQLVVTQTAPNQGLFRYDAANYLGITVSSAGLVTLSAVGAGAGFVVDHPLTLSSVPAFASGDKYLVVDASGNVHVSALGPAL